jgi:hypothetical protein
MKLTLRGIHRDLGYFYLGLIMAFALSGIFLNHRQSWYPSEYKYDAKEIEVQLPAKISDTVVDSIGTVLQIDDRLKGWQIRRESLRLTYVDHMVDINLKTGKGIQERYFKVPILAQSTLLHVTTNNAWIWYSDIFGIAMLTIAVTGMLMLKGEQGFSKRGWKLALAGLLFPLIFLLFLS